MPILGSPRRGGLDKGLHPATTSLAVLLIKSPKFECYLPYLKKPDLLSAPGWKFLPGCDISMWSPRNAVSRNLIGCVGAGDGGTFVDGDIKYDWDLSTTLKYADFEGNNSLELYAEPLTLWKTIFLWNSTSRSGEKPWILLKW